MSKLTDAERSKLPPSAFALPGRRFPIHDLTHAKAALSGAKRALKAGHITQREYDVVIQKATKAIAKFNKDHVGKESFDATSISMWSISRTQVSQDDWYYEAYFGMEGFFKKPPQEKKVIRYHEFEKLITEFSDLVDIENEILKHIPHDFSEKSWITFRDNYVINFDSKIDDLQNKYKVDMTKVPEKISGWTPSRETNVKNRLDASWHKAFSANKKYESLLNRTTNFMESCPEDSEIHELIEDCISLKYEPFKLVNRYIRSILSVIPFEYQLP